ncbi:uncharacterized protein [Drosophila takahashii]|uniref:uncharacterized protein isoform X2 n=1 Tax=Drosophila takahashii TaxID=29030 RepID=UPI001CF8C0FB|nr:uncharacterized protein LOC108061908 [Drosophila takahashii]
MSKSNCRKFSPPPYSGEIQWTDAKIKKILDFVKRNEEYEMPCAKLYYEAMMQETGIKGYWQNMRCQMRFQKMTLSTANKWMSTFKPNDKKAPYCLCPYYDQLVEIFGSDFELVEIRGDLKYSTCYSPGENEDTSVSVIVEKGKKIKRNSTENGDGASDRKIPRKETHLELAKLQFKDEKFEWTKEKEYIALQMKEKKIDNELFLKKLELEHKREIAMYEIKMKYSPEI